MAKVIRIRIAAQFPSQPPLGGMTTAEHAAKLAFERKPFALRLAMIEKGTRRAR
jgi:hypothetical protein